MTHSTHTIRQRRLRLGLAQDDLARRAHCGQSSVSRLENGGKAARAIHAAVLAVLDEAEREAELRRT